MAKKPSNTVKKEKAPTPGALAGAADLQKKPAAARRKAVKPPGKLPAKVAALLKKAVKQPMGTGIRPMLATLVDEPPGTDEWIFEIKWDGYRALAFMDKGEPDLRSRNNKSFSEKFYPIQEALQAWGIRAVVDGEIVAVSDNGAANFGALQQWRSEADGELRYYVFDILWYDGYDLRDLPLTDRKTILEALIPATGAILASPGYATSGKEFMQAVRELGLEGIMAKEKNSTYRSGDRSREWLKIKSGRRQEAIIGGYTKNEGSKKPFSALLVGFMENGKLVYSGKVGTGFTVRQQEALMEQFKPLLRKRQPFTREPDVNKPSRFRPDPPKAEAFWLKPELVCEVNFTEITSDGVMRHPSFQGLRDDKPAREVKVEKETAVTAVTEESPRKKVKMPLKPAGAKTRKTLLNPSEDTQVRKVSGHELKFSNLVKIYWPKEKITKRDMLNYYYQVAPFILPYLAGRPQSMNRYPNGITGKSFYQKDVTDTAPDWMRQYPYTTSEGEDKNFLVPEDDAAILWMANSGSIEMNPWNSTIQTPDHPDWCCLDLDPSEKNTFRQVIETALAVKEVIDGLGVKGYPKTSGSTGIHIYIPLNAKYTYDECQLFGKIIATKVHEMLPGYTSIERMTRNRKGKLYIDYLQNRPKATLAAPYSLRPRPGAPVSMPLHWEEVKPGLKITDFNIHNAMDRIKSEGDLFKPVLGKGVDLQKMLRRLERDSKKA
ncbi:DNA ligase D [Chitinophaga sp.]|uniref:DNA ligase D n=1 Tax=Chitinophaga sp. TaxID=1869181 RepID=UPI002616EC97|nr:DNA ligase D [uncultured Chitinophaga sp.]